MTLNSKDTTKSLDNNKLVITIVSTNFAYTTNHGNVVLDIFNQQAIDFCELNLIQAKKNPKWRKRHGKLHSKNKQTRHRHREHYERRKSKKRSNPDECLFRIYKFDPANSFHRKAIYSAAYSNETMGRFIAFGRDGKFRSHFFYGFHTNQKYVES